MKILVYDDNVDFGGHQAMACHGIEALAKSPGVELVCMINPENRRLAERLAGFDVLTDPCSPRLLKRLNPELMLCIQGDMGQSNRGVSAAKNAGIECVSYLALPHTLHAMGATLGALRDGLNRYRFNQPDRYIVISESMQTLLRDRGITVPVDVVPNGIPTPPNHKPRASSLRAMGVLGRIEFKQKQQDFMVETFLHHPETFSGCQLLIAGSGPDEKHLKRMVEGKESIKLQSWLTDPEAFYDAIDMLVIPSRYEGVPLVMLEALIRGIPVIGSRCDGMRDMLPKAWTFEPGSGTELADTFSSVRNSWQNDIEALSEKIAIDASFDIFKARFCAAVTGNR